MTDDSTDSAVAEYLGPALAAVSRFGRMLAEEGVERGLIGPREVPRLWDRHLLNSAAIGHVLPPSGTVMDVGSGAGLPGIVVACLRPDLRVVLVEPMERRTRWLTHVVETLALENAEVIRARAEELHGTLMVEAVTARAVAPMDRLARWTLPLLTPGGVLLAMKGQRAAEELESAADVLEEVGGSRGEVIQVGTVAGVEPTSVVRVVRLRTPGAATSGTAEVGRSGKVQGGRPPAGGRRGAVKGRGARSPRRQR